MLCLNAVRLDEQLLEIVVRRTINIVYVFIIVNYEYYLMNYCLLALLKNYFKNSDICFFVH